MLTEAVQRCSTDHLRAVSHVGVLRFISQLLFHIAGNQRRSSCAHRTSCFDGTCKNNKYDFVTVSRTIFFFFFAKLKASETGEYTDHLGFRRKNVAEMIM